MLHGCRIRLESQGIKHGLQGNEALLDVAPAALGAGAIYLTHVLGHDGGGSREPTVTTHDPVHHSTPVISEED